LHLRQRNFEITLPIFVNAVILFSLNAIASAKDEKNPHRSADFSPASFLSTQVGAEGGI
jgi:hypothetical protein